MHKTSNEILENYQGNQDIHLTEIMDGNLLS